MLEVSSLRSPSKAAADQRGGFVVGDHHVGFPTSAVTDDDDFMVDDNLLDYIDFSSCCDMPFFDADGDILPDLEVDPTDSLLAEFSSPETSPRPPPDEKQVVAPKSTEAAEDEVTKKADDDDAEKAAAAAGGVLLAVARKQEKGDEVTIITEEVEEDSAGAGSSDAKSSSSAAAAGVHISSKKKASSAGKDSNNGKRKVKVDWTPELHRRFVQAVEQLGIDKAVPSRILEIMGIEGLTRHNIASHLQKYRSHRKHLMAREAEAATWAQKRQLYAAAPVARKAVEAAAAAAGPPWVVPTIGFPPPPPPAAMAPHPPPPFCRPLHVWGHPPTTCAAAVEAPAATTMLPLWPRHLAPPRAWVDPGYWHHQQQYNAAGRTKWGPPAAAVTQGTPCVVPPPPAAMVPRFPHPSMYSRPPVNVMVPPPPPPPAPTMMTTTTTTTKLAELQLQLDAHPSKESIDAAIGDVLVKPWLPLPLGLKPPSLDSVMSELHRHGIPKIPPATS